VAKGAKTALDKQTVRMNITDECRQALVLANKAKRDASDALEKIKVETDKVVAETNAKRAARAETFQNSGSVHQVRLHGRPGLYQVCFKVGNMSYTRHCHKTPDGLHYVTSTGVLIAAR
jgi:hypothetical protein